MEDFDKYYTIEVKGSKGWEVVATHDNIFDAQHRFTEELESTPIMPVRLTSPTDMSIYDDVVKPEDLPARATIGRPASVELNPPQHQ